MIGWLVAALQVAPIAITCPPGAFVGDRPKTVCIARDAQILTPVIRFTSNHEALTQRGRRVIDDVAKLLITEKIQRVEIRVHNQDAVWYGFNKTTRHARVLKAALVKRGVSDSRFVVRAYGEEQPLTRKTDPTAAWVNTRVEIWLVGLDRLRVR